MYMYNTLDMAVMADAASWAVATMMLGVPSGCLLGRPQNELLIFAALGCVSSYNSLRLTEDALVKCIGMSRESVQDSYMSFVHRVASLGHISSVIDDGPSSEFWTSFTNYRSNGQTTTRRNSVH